MDNFNEFKKALINTSLEVGVPIYSDEKVCQTLAWLLHFGGYTEASVFNDRLNFFIQYSQKKMNIYGGEVPNGKLMPLLQQYSKELLLHIKLKTPKPDWLVEFEKEYNLEPKKVKK